MFRIFRRTGGVVRASAVALALVAAGVFAPAVRAADDAPPLTERQKVVHALNRLGYGPRPGDVERVEAMGLPAYVRQQLHPETIDDAAAEKAVARFDTLGMSSSHLLDAFYGDVKLYLQTQMAAGNGDEMKMRFGIDPNSMYGGPATRPAAATQPAVIKQLVAQYNAAREWGDLSKRDAVRGVGELQQAKLARAILSERQLNEVLVDFWSNHFNIDVKKAPCHALKVADDREVIRPHVLGKFRDLLGASAHSPAMLVYLDNQENAVARERSGLEKFAINVYIRAKFGMSSGGLISDKEGPNENYGRELLELHTLGVDGGYTQKDVQEVARAFSGWGFSGLTAKFEFQSNRHDNGKKTVLGTDLPANGGAKDGERVLDLLAAHPATARFISRKLCQRFVADDPPADLVARVTAAFRDTGGDLRQVVEAIVTSPEFLSPQAYRAKIKSPLEYAASAVRAAGGQLVEPKDASKAKAEAIADGSVAMGYEQGKPNAPKRKTLARHVQDMGQPLFACAPPTGYSEVSKKWVSPGALIDRLNFALALTGQDVPSVKTDPAKLALGADADQSQAVLDRLTETLLHGDLSPTSRAALQRNALPQGEGKTVDVAKVAALVLGSPEFQRR